MKFERGIFMNLFKAFRDFPNEANAIGMILSSYTSLEVDLMNCVKSVRSDLDTVLKVMYRSRGEGNRIEIADALGFQAYKEMNLGNEFKDAITAIKYCVKIRNQYAHCIWWNDYSGHLAFSNIETLAKSNQKITDLKNMNICHVDLNILHDQLSYYEYASDFLMWILNEGLRVRGNPNIVLPNRPSVRIAPSLCS